MEFLKRLPDTVERYLDTYRQLRSLSRKFDDRVFAELSWRHVRDRQYITGNVLGPQETIDFLKENIYKGARVRESVDTGFRFLQDCSTPHGIEVNMTESGKPIITRGFYYSRDEIEVGDLNFAVGTLLRAKATRPELFVEYCPLVVVTYPFTNVDVLHPRQVSVDRLPITPDKFYEFSESLWNRELSIAGSRQKVAAK